jgi:hypothetical protein
VSDSPLVPGRVGGKLGTGVIDYRYPSPCSLNGPLGSERRRRDELVTVGVLERRPVQPAAPVYVGRHPRIESMKISMARATVAT